MIDCGSQYYQTYTIFGLLPINDKGHWMDGLHPTKKGYCWMVGCYASMHIHPYILGSRSTSLRLVGDSRKYWMNDKVMQCKKVLLEILHTHHLYNPIKASAHQY